MIHDAHATDMPAALPAKAVRKSKHTVAFLKAAKKADGLGERAVAILEKVSPLLSELDQEITKLREHSVNALLSEKAGTVRANVEQMDSKMVSAQNTVRDLSARFLDLARILTSVESDVEPVAASAALAGYDL